MRMSKLFVQTLREFPADAEVISHKLLVRAGYIRKLTNGVYNFLPLMWRVLKKVENIVREEMDAAGAQELLMPFVQPSELWQESGRWDVYGKELMRLKDRHGREMCLGPTHEEVITSIAREGIRSYKQLPVNLYQIQSKFRDEIRPRFGLLRGREFIMKDAYSFDVDEEGLDKSYEIMAQAYRNIFERCGLETKMVQSDSGAIGGSVSHEFMVLVNEEAENNAGENDVFYCTKCGYSANSNHAVSILNEVETDGKFSKAEIIDTPNTHSIEELSAFLNIPSTVICKALIYVVDGKYVLALIRGDRTVEETKLMNVFAGNDIRIARNDEIEEIMNASGFDAVAGFIGPKGLKNIEIVADETVKDLKNFVIGCNQNDKHLVGANWGIDVELPQKIADIRLVEENDKCVDCGAELKVTKGIEVGNIFKLGTKYSKTMNATFTDKDGKEKPFIMGCYGIGISRTAAAAVERHHDEYGIKWPLAIAPYTVIVVPVSDQDETQMKVAEEIYNKLLAENVEVLIDDRSERAGVKLKDADLIGIPYRITVGKTIKDNLVEFKTRANNNVETITPDEAIAKILSL
ncbi:TPA: proline--tRNA ligase [Candidatus Avigastranaerophilus faecigallinarum]|nr:proline--tRNA ligase [Candidatus Avigastranaerophilus faecigallinarum]